MRLTIIWLFLLLPMCLNGQATCGTTGMPRPLKKTPNRNISRTPVVFPVVVHIVYTNEEENLSDDQIRSQIDILNRDFSGETPGKYRISPSFRELVATPNWQFCLASRDPDGLPTSGIIRVRTNVPGIAHPSALERGLRKIKHTALGGSDAWDTDHYINIWIGSTGQDVVIGDATFPGTAKPGEDGIMVDYRIFGGLGISLGYFPYHLGKTLTHEMGHYFNLAHLSGNGGCEVDDDVEDTPLQGREYFSCTPGLAFSCGSEDMIQNFLSLASDPCLLFFTRGQVERMESALTEFRMSLLDRPVECSRPSLPPGRLADNVLVISSLGSGQLIVQFKGYLDHPANLQLYDMAGRLLSEWRTAELSHYPIFTRDLPGGIYLLRITLDNEEYTVKVVL